MIWHDMEFVACDDTHDSISCDTTCDDTI